MSAMLLRIIACVSMLLDHIGYQYDIEFLRCVGRMAFPIFVFLICNGYRHTSSKLRYALRIGIFALISQVPYSLFSKNAVWLDKGNVFMTLLLALLCIWFMDEMLKKKLWAVAFLPTIAVLAGYYLDILHSDYGIRGVIFAFTFFFFARQGEEKPMYIAAGMLLGIYYPVLLRCVRWVLGDVAPTVSQWEVTQIYSLFALPLILRYNGKKGGNIQSPVWAKLCQLGFYFFYPVHQLILWLLRDFMK